MELVCNGLDEISKATEWLIRNSGNHSIWLFEGEMGAGKTTLIKAVCQQLGVVDQVSSPTFSIVNHYQTQNGASIYHFDFYRIKSEEEALDIGVEEYFYSGDICLIEWPSLVGQLIPERHLEVRILVNENQSRTISLSFYE